MAVGGDVLRFLCVLLSCSVVEEGERERVREREKDERQEAGRRQRRGRRGRRRRRRRRRTQEGKTRRERGKEGGRTKQNTCNGRISIHVESLIQTCRDLNYHYACA